MKYKVNSHFFDAWSPNMAYVLGLIYSDGNLENADYIRGKYLRISNNDLALLKMVKKTLSSEHKIATLPPKWSRGTGKCQGRQYLSKIKYLLRIGDHHIYNSLLKLGLTPRKSLRLKFPTVPINILADFIRGYFDGDGSVYFDKNKNRLSVVFSCGSREFLGHLSTTLAKQVAIKRQAVLKGTKCYQLKYSTFESIKIFKFMYYSNTLSIFIKRKKEMFKWFLSKKAPLMPKISKFYRLIEI